MAPLTGYLCGLEWECCRTVSSNAVVGATLLVVKIQVLKYTEKKVGPPKNVIMKSYNIKKFETVQNHTTSIRSIY